MKSATSNRESSSSKETKKSVETGKKAIDAAKKFDGKQARQSEKDSKADAKKFRNEG